MTNTSDSIIFQIFSEKSQGPSRLCRVSTFFWRPDNDDHNEWFAIFLIYMLNMFILHFCRHQIFAFNIVEGESPSSPY